MDMRLSWDPVAVLIPRHCGPQNAVLGARKDIAYHVALCAAAVCYGMKDPLRSGHWKDLGKHMKLVQLTRKT